MDKKSPAQRVEHTFSQEVKAEIAQHLEETSHEFICAFLSGFTKQNGSLTFNNGQMGIDVQTVNAVVARKVFQLLRKHFPRIQLEIVVRKMVKLKQQNIFVLRIYDKSKAFFEDIHFLDETGFVMTIPENYTTGELFQAYVQGLFLGTGSINNLQQARYHLEISFTHEVHALDVQTYMKQVGIIFKIIKRRNAFVLYIKDSTIIGDFLAFMQANSARFAFEDVRISRDMMNSMNRLINCEVANEQKTLKAAEQQIQNIEMIIETWGEEFFSEREQAIVNMRLAFPDASLAELSEILFQEKNIQISKSGLNHAFRKVASQAEKIRHNDLEVNNKNKQK